MVFTRHDNIRRWRDSGRRWTKGFSFFEATEPSAAVSVRWSVAQRRPGGNRRCPPRVLGSTAFTLLAGIWPPGTLCSAHRARVGTALRRQFQRSASGQSEISPPLSGGVTFLRPSARYASLGTGSNRLSASLALLNRRGGLHLRSQTDPVEKFKISL
jgi:hypothetical protein